MNIEEVLKKFILKEHLRTAASDGSSFVKKFNYHSFISKFKKSVRKMSMTVFTVFSRSYQ